MPSKKDKPQEPINSELFQAMDSLRILKGAKEALAKQTKELNEQEEYLEGIIISKLRSEGLDKVSITGVGTASVSIRSIPTIQDWDTLINWITKKKEFGLLKKSISSRAWEDLREEGVEPPGIQIFEEDKLNFRRK